MALTPLTKLTYHYAEEPVSSVNLNEIQDAIIELQNQWTDPENVGDIGDLVPAANNLVAAINQLVNTMTGVSGNMADVYSSSSTYKVGQLCIYNNTLYKCNTAITTAESWTAAHWTATTIAEEIENRVLWFPGVTVSATTGNIINLADSRITPDHVLTSCIFANDSYITALSSWSTETAGTLKISGTCSTATTADVILVKKNN